MMRHDPRKEKRVNSLIQNRKNMKRNFIKNINLNELSQFVIDPHSSVSIDKAVMSRLDRSHIQDDYKYESSIASIKCDLTTNVKQPGDIGTMKSKPIQFNRSTGRK